MGENAESYLSALAIMRRWQWTFYDPDGFPRRLGLDLSEVVSRLAMEGLKSPHLTLLGMLCHNHLFGFGQFKWMKYESGDHFQFENFNAEVTINQWRSLKAAIDYEQQMLDNMAWRSNIDLPMLDISDCARYEWDFRDNRFSFALRSSEGCVHDSAYFEEWFSAWDIDIRLPEGGADGLEGKPVKEPTEAPPVGRPLAAWWPDFVAELVAYTVQVGLPDGIGHQGQSEVIKEVCARLQVRGKEEPSRSQIQESVNAVLRRMRSAGK